jgi:phosphonate transport system substrate-binding protein
VIDRAVRVATHLAPSVLPAYAMAARRIGERLGRPAELIVAADYRRCVQDIDEVCFVCSVPYLLLSDAGRIAMAAVAAPILSDPRAAGRPVYHSEVIVRADAPFRAFVDLAGTRWAYNEPFSHSGFVVALHHLARHGYGPDFIGAWVEAGFHDDAIHAVRDGRADWAAIDAQVLGIWLRQRPALADEIRVIDTLGPSTIQPVVVSTTRLSGAEAEAVAAALLDLGGDDLERTILGACGIERFVRITDDGYGDIRAMLSAVRAGGLLPDWWDRRWAGIVEGQ